MDQRRTQASRSQATRDQIVQAALTVFALKGYAAASMDDICLAAGCSKGGLYHHFRAKSAILSALVDRLAASGALIPQAAGDPGAPSEAQGRVLVDIWAAAARDEALRTRLAASTSSATGGRGLGLSQLLSIGALIQLLTRGEGIDAGEIAARLGIKRAA